MFQLIQTFVNLFSSLNVEVFGPARKENVILFENTLILTLPTSSSQASKVLES